MQRIGVAIRAAELRLLNRLSREQTQSTMLALRRALHAKAYRPNTVLDCYDRTLIETNQALANSTIASLNILNEQRVRIADILNRIACL